jgi:hypothetical protein
MRLWFLTLRRRRKSKLQVCKKKKAQTITHKSKPFDLTKTKCWNLHVLLFSTEISHCRVNMTTIKNKINWSSSRNFIPIPILRNRWKMSSAFTHLWSAIVQPCGSYQLWSGYNHSRNYTIVDHRTYYHIDCNCGSCRLWPVANNTLTSLHDPDIIYLWPWASR